MKSLHYLNNAWVTEKDLTISVFDLSVIRGYGVFDFLRTYNNKPFYFDEHIDRLFRSAKLLGITVPKTKPQIKKIILEGLVKNTFPEKNIRIVVTGGVAVDGITPGKPSFFVIFTNAHDYPKEFYEKGVKVITYPHIRAFPGAKSLNYLSGVVALQQARKEKAVEALFVGPNGEIYEGTTSNFFAVIKGKLVTPKNSILLGITRTIVIAVAKKEGIEVVERDMNVSEIPQMSEAFITASNKEVMPVVRINSIPINKQKVGEITRRIYEEYKRML